MKKKKELRLAVGSSNLGTRKICNKMLLFNANLFKKIFNKPLQEVMIVAKVRTGVI